MTKKNEPKPDGNTKPEVAAIPDVFVEVNRDDVTLLRSADGVELMFEQSLGFQIWCTKTMTPTSSKKKDPWGAESQTLRRLIAMNGNVPDGTATAHFAIPMAQHNTGWRTGLNFIKAGDRVSLNMTTLDDGIDVAQIRVIRRKTKVWSFNVAMGIGCIKN